MNPCGVKVINDWFNIKERGRPMGFFNAASTIGVAVSPPIGGDDAGDGLRGMFITIGVLGIFSPLAGICVIATASTRN
ncbi:MFS transporter [Escherichia coli]